MGENELWSNSVCGLSDAMIGYIKRAIILARLPLSRLTLG